MEEIYKNRLLKLADFLDALPDERFNYASWVGPDWQGKSDLSCGTTACALGWAATIPEFRELGLTLKTDRRMVGYVCMLNTSMMYDTNSGVEAEYASNTIFGLSKAEHYWLFVPGNGWHKPNESSSAKEVAQHIRDFVENPDLCSSDGEDYDVYDDPLLYDVDDPEEN